MAIPNRSRHKKIGSVLIPFAFLVLTACGAHSSTNSSGQPSDHMGNDMHSVDADHGLSDTRDGYKLTIDNLTFDVGKPGTLRFRITNPNGETQTNFAIDQTKLMHTYVIRNDTTNFQHLHPELTDGTFSVPIAFSTSGSYRIYCDFVAKDSADKDHPLTLSATATVPGDSLATPLPPASNSASVDGYVVTFSGEMMAGMGHDLTATITKDGQPVTDLEPYLDTFAHLTAFNADTLAVTHLHPRNVASSGQGGPTLMFMAEFPASGNYRLFVQFRTAGQLHTAAVTYHVS